MLKPRLEKYYEKIVSEDFILLYNYENIDQLPSFDRAVFHSTNKSFALDKLALLQSFSTLFIETGQRPVSTRAHKSIAFFNIRKGHLLGLKLYLRKSRLFHLLDKLLIFVIPKLLSTFRLEINTITKKKIKKSEMSLLQNNLQKQILQGKQDDFLHRKRSLSLAKRKENKLVISYKDTTLFPEISALLIFFNSAIGFSFDCSFKIPLSQNKANINSKKRTTNPALDKSLLAVERKRQFLSAFQYPVNILTPLLSQNNPK